MLLALHGISKTFRIYNKASDRLKERLFGLVRHQTHHALQNIHLHLQSGESVAVLGQNGAGKSTLLKLISGVLLPDQGHIERHGRITGLLELGTGFDLNLTGRDNIYINGQLIGMTQAELAAKEADIIAFAELGDYIDAPVRTYSSGMFMRLGFSIAIHADPACFVVDEALAVGDARFQQKCMARIRHFRDQGGALLFVSHDIAAVKQICDRAIVLHRGHIAFDGPVVEAGAAYQQLMAELDGSIAVVHDKVFGRQQLRFTQVSLTGEHGEGVFMTGETLTLRLEVEADIDLEDVTLGFMIRDRFGQDVFGINSHLLGHSLTFHAGSRQTFLYHIDAQLGHGKYTLGVSLHTGLTHLENCQHWLEDAISFRIEGVIGPAFSGITRLSTRFTPAMSDHGQQESVV